MKAIDFISGASAHVFYNVDDKTTGDNKGPINTEKTGPKTDSPTKDMSRWTPAGDIRNPIVYHIIKDANGNPRGVKVLSAKKITKDELLSQGKTVVLVVDESKLAINNDKNASTTGSIFLNIKEVQALIKDFGLIHDIQDSLELIACINAVARTPQGFLYTELLMEMAESHGIVRDASGKPLNLTGPATIMSPSGDPVEVKQATTFEGEDGKFYFHNEHVVNRRVTSILFSQDDMSNYVARYRKAAKAADERAIANEMGN